GLTQDEIARSWAPFIAWVKSRPQVFKFSRDPLFIVLPGRAFWEPATLLKLPGVVMQDARRGAPAENIYWAGNRGEAGQVLHAYQSAWLPKSLLAPARPRGAGDGRVPRAPGMCAAS